MKVYIAGPMSGIPQFNYPAFANMAKDLRKVVTEPGQHVEVFSPAEADAPHVQEFALASPDGQFPDPSFAKRWPTHGAFIGLGVQRIIDGAFDAIVVLPGWDTSRGARCEVMAGLASGAKIVKVEHAYGGRAYMYEMSRGELLRGLEGIA